ncbi:MAG: Uncharacterized protein CEN91_387 [Candidatus Berkelbacteria bacterium Licking1014_85]|uniref:Membrane protein 6-pyruvoyl-tetrahydropterin synthase-related domain-containing protein n=1 Tax=Candidatus Berkelbacteria bacterium Licking1014_85 TaxID=2017148 RepID=A0A554LIH3_9BACT|nr:MAG: Uncharacterized protein CEN91_387 [Candidatus Berkelbacteria bacterium Licking1014_85]
MTSKKIQKYLLQNYPYIVVWLAIYGTLFYYLPLKYLFINAYVGGGDLGSHQTAFKEMIESIFPSFFGWTNVWYLGMPLFTFYFPLPFWFGALLTKLFIPATIAFKIIVMLGVFALPLSAYYFAKKIKMKAPIAVSVFSLIPLLLSSNTIVGGSIQSTFAGEFTHLWSLNFLLIFLGLIFEKKRTALPAIIFGLMVLSHSLSLVYVASFIAIWWLIAERNKKDFIYYLKVFGFGAILISWYLIPFLVYRRYSTDLGYFPGRDLWNYLYTEKILWLAFAFILFSFWKSKTNWFFVTLIATAILLWQFLPADIGAWLPRFIAYYLFFVPLFMGQNIFVAEIWKIKPIGMLFSILLIFVISIVCDNRVLTGNYKYAMDPPQPDSVNEMVNYLNHLPRSRVLFEYDDAVSVFFSPRGYELLPIFANQDSVAGLYLESAYSTPAVYTAMAQISVHKEQVGNYFQLLPQADIKSEDAYDTLKFLSIKYIISGKNKDIFLSRTNEYKFLKNFDENLYLFEVLNIESLITPADQSAIYTQKLSKIEREKYIINWLLSDTLHNFYATKNIPKAEVGVGNDKIVAKNLIPNQPYWIKISYFPAWKAKGGKLFDSAPGLMLIIPDKDSMELNYKPLGI